MILMYCYGSSFHASRFRLVVATPSAVLQQRSLHITQTTTITVPTETNNLTPLPSTIEKVSSYTSLVNKQHSFSFNMRVIQPMTLSETSFWQPQIKPIRKQNVHHISYANHFNKFFARFYCRFSVIFWFFEYKVPSANLEGVVFFTQTDFGTPNSFRTSHFSFDVHPFSLMAKRKGIISLI